MKVHQEFPGNAHILKVRGHRKHIMSVSVWSIHKSFVIILKVMKCFVQPRPMYGRIRLLKVNVIIQSALIPPRCSLFRPFFFFSVTYRGSLDMNKHESSSQKST